MSANQSGIERVRVLDADLEDVEAESFRLVQQVQRLVGER